MSEQDCQIHGGATLWARQTIDSKIFYDKPDKYFKIWFYLVNRVNHKKKRRWDRGECFIIYKEIEEYTKATPDQIKKCLTYLRKSGMISTTRSTRGVTLKIPKYSHYQTLDNYYYDVKSTTDGTREALEKHQRSTPINKNDKNDKKSTVKKTVTPPKFIYQEELAKLSVSKRADLKLVGYYFKRREMNIPTKAVFQKELRRALAEIKTLKDFPKEKIVRAFDYAESNYPEWTIETVGKVVTKI